MKLSVSAPPDDIKPDLYIEDKPTAHAVSSLTRDAGTYAKLDLLLKALAVGGVLLIAMILKREL